MLIQQAYRLIEAGDPEMDDYVDDLKARFDEIKFSRGFPECLQYLMRRT